MPNSQRGNAARDGGGPRSGSEAATALAASDSECRTGSATERHATWIAIARTGTFQDSEGRDQTFNAADLDAIAANYDPARLEAPLVFGHPKDSAPAYGWVTGLKRDGHKLLARLAQVPGEVRELVGKGRYRYVSMSLTPDRKTLRHVGLLGAVPPAIDGLGPVELAGEPGIIINVTSEDHAAREGGAPRGGSEAATAFAASDSERRTGRATERHQKEGGDMPTPEELQQQIGALQQQLEALKAENAKLKSQLEESGKGKEEAEKKAESAAAEFAAYKSAVEVKDRETRVDALIAAGKLEPAKREETLSFAAALAAVTVPVNFSAPDGKAEQVTAQEKFFRDLEARQPDARFLDFAAYAPLPAHAAASEQTVNPADLTAKL